MPEQLTKFLTTYAVHLTPLILILSAAIAVSTLRASMKWNRQHYAHEFIRTWNDNVTTNRAAIFDEFHKAFIAHETLSEDQCRKKIFCRDDKEDLLEAITKVLNYHEGFATAYRENIADLSMIRRSVKENISLWYTVFQNFIRMESCRRGYEPWRAFTDLIEMWEIEENFSKHRSPSRFARLEKLRSGNDWRRARRMVNKRERNGQKTHVPKHCRRITHNEFAKKPCFMRESARCDICYSEKARS